MPPTFAYAMCFLIYLTLMAVGLAACAFLAILPSRRRLSLRLASAIVCSLPGLLAFQLVIGIPLAVLLAVVLGFYSVFHPPDWVQWVVGIPTILIMFSAIAAASVLGSYTGGSIGWQIGAGVPLRAAITQRRIILYVVSRFQRRGA